MITTEIKNLSTCRKELNITLPKEELEPIREQQIKRIQKEIQIPGFRKGKAPKQFIKKQYGQLIEAYMLEAAAEESFKQALAEHDIAVVDQPEAKKIEFNEDGDLVSVIEVDTYPDIELKKITGLELTRDKYVITDKIVDETIERMRREKAEIRTVDGQVEENHLVYFDMQQLDESGVPIVGKKYNDLKVKVGEGRFDPELEKQLIGLKTGDEKQIVKEYPADFPQKEFAGKKEYFKVSIKKIQEEILPELNDEFVAEVDENLKTVDELKAEVRKRLELEYKMESENRFAADLTQALLEANPFDVPEALIQNYLNHIVEDVKRRDPKLKEEDIRQHYRHEAEFNVKWFYLKDKIAREQNIKVEDEDVNKFLNELKDEKVRELYEKNPVLLDRVKEDILNRKIVDYIVNNSKVKENEIKLD
ncbi:MAG TPA: trigger factor [Caldithrix abyssi]|uniref:Trigger factor n=1 Tax=Caldithrix abyssi TaxID=187145 RepID=A0A7V4WWE5_CALAY|nr:trigger factor [Caldithrix abyssi]